MRNSRQQGLSLFGMLMLLVVVGFFFMLAMRLTPAVVEYFAIQRAIQKVKHSSTTIEDARTNFDKQIAVDDIKSVTSKDLDIIKDGNSVDIAFTYSYSVPLVGLDNVRLVVDFSGDTRGHKGEHANSNAINNL